MRLIDADAIRYDQLLNTGNKEHPLEWAVSQSLINSMPTIEAESVRHGRWLWVDKVRCSICNHELQTTGLPSYCPNCRAKMDEVRR